MLRVWVISHLLEAWCIILLTSPQRVWYQEHEIVKGPYLWKLSYRYMRLPGGTLYSKCVVVDRRTTCAVECRAYYVTTSQMMNPTDHTIQIAVFTSSLAYRLPKEQAVGSLVPVEDVETYQASWPLCLVKVCEASLILLSRLHVHIKILYVLERRRYLNYVGHPEWSELQHVLRNMSLSYWFIWFVFPSLDM